MKPSPWVDSIRAAAVLAALIATPTAGQPAGVDRAGFGSVSLRMPRAAAVAAAGPGALVGPLCGGAEGVLFPTADGEAMAMFDDGHVSEMALTPPGDGAERAREDCARTARVALAGLVAHHRLSPARRGQREDAGIIEEVSHVESPQGHLAAVSRWSARTTACWVTLHWIAPGAESRIRPE